MKKSIASAALAISLVACAATANAQSVWSGAVDNSWNTAGNWGVPPVSSNTLVVQFDGSAASFTPTNPIPYDLNTLLLLGGTSYALSGIRLTFDGVGPAMLVQAPGSSITNDLRFNVDTLVIVSTPFTLSAVVDGAGGMNVAGGSSLTFASNTIYAGTTSIDTGTTLRLGNGVAGPTTITDIVNNGILEFEVPTGITVSGLLVGSGSVRVVDFSAGGLNWLHAGTTTIDAGANAGAQLTNNALLTVNGQFDTGGTTVGSLTGTGIVNINSGTFTMGGDNTDQAFTGNQFGGAGDVVKVGTGRQILAHNLTYAGTTTINGGTLALGNGAGGPTLVPGDIFVNAELELNKTTGITVPGVFGTGNVTVTGGSAVAGQLSHTGTTTVNAGALLAGPITTGTALLTLNGTYDNGGASVGSLTGTGTLNNNSGTFTTGGDNTNATFSGFTISGPGNFTKVGTGRQTLAHTNTYSGNTTISAGVLALGNGATGPAVAFTIVNNAALELNVPGGISLNNGVTGSGTVTVVGGLAQSPIGLTHTGTTTINAGATIGTSITNNALLTLNGTLDTGGATVGSLTGSGTLNVNSGSATIGGDNTSTTFTGVIGSAGAFVKIGTGTLTLTGANTITGGTTVNAGRLNVNGSIPGTVTVNAGGTLGGTGTVSGPVVVNAGGSLAPGLSPGLLATGNLALAGVLLQEIEGTTVGTQYDSINVTGTVNLAGATLTVSGLYVPVAGNTFTIINNDGADGVVGTFAGLPEGATVVLNGVNLRISYIGGTGNDVVLAALAPAPGPGGPSIPTLSEWMLVLLALLMMTVGLCSRSFRNNQ